MQSSKSIPPSLPSSSSLCSLKTEVGLSLAEQRAEATKSSSAHELTPQSRAGKQLA